MKNIRIESYDRMSPGGLRGEVIFGTGRKQVPYTDPYGNKTFITDFEKVIYKGKNIVPIGGYQFAFNKLFNIGLDKESTLRVGDLNDEAPQMKIGVSRGEYESIYYDAESSISNSSMIIHGGVNIPAMNFIFGFLVGDGASKEDNMTALAPNYKQRTLFNSIPFRMSTDGSELLDGQYFGKVESFQGSIGIEPIASYYIKKFDQPAPRIIHAWVTDNPDELNIVDDSVFASTSSIPIESYVEINMSINKDDCRGYFTSTDTTPRINEFGLVSGWYNPTKNDYESCRLFTIFSRPNIVLSEGDSIEIVYRLYAR